MECLITYSFFSKVNGPGWDGTLWFCVVVLQKYEWYVVSVSNLYVHFAWRVKCQFRLYRTHEIDHNPPKGPFCKRKLIKIRAWVNNPARYFL